MARDMSRPRSALVSVLLPHLQILRVEVLIFVSQLQVLLLHHVHLQKPHAWSEVDQSQGCGVPSHRDGFLSL